MKVEDLNYIDYSELPFDLRVAVRKYIEYGIDPGSFLTAVIDNNLIDSFGRANANNKFLLSDIVSWFYWNGPSHCWGSIEKRVAWRTEQKENLS